MFMKRMVCQFLYFYPTIRNKNEENKFKQTFCVSSLQTTPPTFLFLLTTGHLCISSMQNHKQAHLPRTPPRKQVEKEPYLKDSI